MHLIVPILEHATTATQLCDTLLVLKRPFCEVILAEKISQEQCQVKMILPRKYSARVLRTETQIDRGCHLPCKPKARPRQSHVRSIADFWSATCRKSILYFARAPLARVENTWVVLGCLPGNVYSPRDRFSPQDENSFSGKSPTLAAHRFRRPALEGGCNS